MLSESGPQHAKTFEVKCSIMDLKNNTCIESVTTTGSSHVKARQSAAEIALKQTKLDIPTKELISKKKNGKFLVKKETFFI